MRKLILISAAVVLFASASAHAGEMLAAADAPAVTIADNIPQPLPPVAKKDDAKKDDTKPQVTDSARPLTAKPLPSKPRSQARDYSSDEAKARRIAAKYGISW
jgi:hypothetical protein